MERIVRAAAHLPAEPESLFVPIHHVVNTFLPLALITVPLWSVEPGGQEQRDEMSPLVYHDYSRILHVAALPRPHAILPHICRYGRRQDRLDPGALALGEKVSVFEEQSSSVSVPFVLEKSGRIDEEERVGVDEDRFSEGAHEDREGLCCPS